MPFLTHIFYYYYYCTQLLKHNHGNSAEPEECRTRIKESFVTRIIARVLYNLMRRKGKGKKNPIFFSYTADDSFRCGLDDIVSRSRNTLPTHTALSPSFHLPLLLPPQQHHKYTHARIVAHVERKD